MLETFCPDLYPQNDFEYYKKNIKEVDLKLISQKLKNEILEEKNKKLLTKYLTENNTLEHISADFQNLIGENAYTLSCKFK